MKLQFFPSLLNVFPCNIVGLVSNLNIPGVPISGNGLVRFIPIVFKAIKLATKKTTRMQSSLRETQCRVTPEMGHPHCGRNRWFLLNSDNIGIIISPPIWSYILASFFFDLLKPNKLFFYSKKSL